MAVIDPEDPSFLLDASIAKLTIWKRSWNYEVDGIAQYKDYHYEEAKNVVDCSAEQLFFDNNDAMQKKITSDIAAGAFSCVTDTQIRGDSSSIHASELVFLLETSG